MEMSSCGCGVAVLHAAALIARAASFVVVVIVFHLIHHLGDAGENWLAFRDHLALPRFDFLALRHHDHRESTAVQAWRHLDLREISKRSDDVIHAIFTLVTMRHFAAAEVLDDLHAMAFARMWNCRIDCEMRASKQHSQHFHAIFVSLAFFAVLRDINSLRPKRLRPQQKLD